MTEEWTFTGEGYNECTAHHSLVTDPSMMVICPEYNKEVCKGTDIGF